MRQSCLFDDTINEVVMRIGLAFLLLGIASCGGGSGGGTPPPPPDPVLTFSLFPQTDMLGPSGERPFGAAVVSNGAIVGGVTWRVHEVDGGSMNGNTYTAPNRTGIFHITGSSTIDPTVNATAEITVIAAGFRPTDDMVLARTAHTATLLPNGQVLITGGDPCFLSYLEGSIDDPCPLEEAELYDPMTGVFLSTGNMFAQRSFHTATLLPSGKVLITGGSDADAELYDPATGAFALTGSMSVNRSSHSATLLSNGRVLVAGGSVSGTSSSSAEVYDPQTGTFSPTGGAGMTAPRSFHTATRLENGQVLILGGLDSSGTSQATAELYDPVTGAFTVTGSSSDARAHHTATLLGNGTVLVTGGVEGDSGNVGNLSACEIYDPSNGTFRTTGGMFSVRGSHFAVVLASGRVLVSGGDTINFMPRFRGYTAEIYDPSSESFTQTGSMGAVTFNRALSAAVALPDGRVLVTGGSGLASAELYQ